MNDVHSYYTVYIYRLCLSANQYTLCSLLMKGQTSKQQAAQRLRIYNSLIKSAIWSGRALSLGTKVTTSDNFRAGFKTMSSSQPVYSLFAADKGTLSSSAKSLVQLGNTFTQSGCGCLKKCLQLLKLLPLPSHKLHTFPKIHETAGRTLSDTETKSNDFTLFLIVPENFRLRLAVLKFQPQSILTLHKFILA